MVTSNKIRVGIVGVTPNRGFASIAHIPALQALPAFEITAICTTRQDSADVASVLVGRICDAALVQWRWWTHTRVSLQCKRWAVLRCRRHRLA